MMTFKVQAVHQQGICSIQYQTILKRDRAPPLHLSCLLSLNEDIYSMFVAHKQWSIKDWRRAVTRRSARCEFPVNKCP